MSIGNAIKELFGKKKEFSLKDISKTDIVAKQKELGYKRTEIEKKSSLCKKEMDRLTDSYVKADSADKSGMRRLVNNIRLQNEKMKTYDFVTTKLSDVEIFLEKILGMKEMGGVLDNVDEVMKMFPGHDLSKEIPALQAIMEGKLEDFANVGGQINFTPPEIDDPELNALVSKLEKLKEEAADPSVSPEVLRKKALEEILSEKS